MDAQVVEHYHVTLAQAGAEHLREVGVEGQGVHGSGKRHHCHQAAPERKRPDQRSLLAVVARHRVSDPLAFGCAPVAWSHRRVHRRLVEEDEPAVVERSRPTPEPTA